MLQTNGKRIALTVRQPCTRKRAGTCLQPTRTIKVILFDDNVVKTLNKRVNKTANSVNVNVSKYLQCRV